MSGHIGKYNLYYKGTQEKFSFAWVNTQLHIVGLLKAEMNKPLANPYQSRALSEREK